MKILTVTLNVQTEDSELDSTFETYTITKGYPEDWDDDQIADDLEDLNKVFALMVEAS